MLRRAHTVPAADAACDAVEAAIRDTLGQRTLKDFAQERAIPADAPPRGLEPRVTELRRDATR
jgi:hypothetical protein